ncbi:MAG: hypothetical protein L3J57_14160 [Desulfuromusa sp.]|nr:hypothetical protein [Desulfuromusa sp.]
MTQTILLLFLLCAGLFLLFGGLSWGHFGGQNYNMVPVDHQTYSSGFQSSSSPLPEGEGWRKIRANHNNL